MTHDPSSPPTLSPVIAIIEEQYYNGTSQDFKKITLKLFLAVLLSFFGKKNIIYDNASGWHIFSSINPKFCVKA